MKEWIVKMTSPSGETLSKELEGSYLPVYIVDCPKLHVIPRKYLEYKLRWADKWAYEVWFSSFSIISADVMKSIQGNSPVVNWKEGRTSILS